MTALAGFLSHSDPGRAAPSCRRMLDAQRVFGADAAVAQGSGGIAVGCALHRSLADDSRNVQPLRTGDTLLVGDVRIDNRDELVAALRPAAPSTLTDAELLLAGYQRWGGDVVDRLAGDFAFAIWDGARRALVLARDPLGHRPLHYHRGRDFFAFASMPRGLHALDAVGRAPNLGRAAEFAADLFPLGPDSYWRGIERVEPGHVVTATRDGLRSRRYWRPHPGPLRLSRFDDYVEAYCEQLDRATAAMLRGGGDPVAAHLSAGYDSSAVAATAARLLDAGGGRVLAYTAAPRPGFDGPAPRGRIADESPLAAATAAMHPNVEHCVIRPAGVSPFRLLDERHPLIEQPAGHLCNAAWGSAIKRAAQARGASVLLTGQLGNYTISAGGPALLADFVRTGDWRRWWREARALTQSTPMRWRGVLDNSFGGWLPLPAYRLLSWRFAGGAAHASPQLVRSDWFDHPRARAAEAFRDPRPTTNSAALNLELLQREDSGNFRAASLAQYGIDERDPTGDRRLIEFCLSLPPEMLLKDGVARPLARAALADRLPAPVLDSRVRGYQSADWYEQITPAMVRAEAERLARSDAAAAVIDFDRVRAMIDAWPSGGWDRRSVIGDYRSALLRALSAAHFLCQASGE